MFEVFRFALFAVRTFFGVIALILALYAGLWLFVKVHSAAMGGTDPDAALRRVMSYNRKPVGNDSTIGRGALPRSAHPADPSASGM